MNANEISKKHLVGPFPWDVFPREPGIYIRENKDGNRYYAYYDEYMGWSAFTNTINAALKVKNIYLTSFPALPWYGITEEFYKELSK